MNFQLAREIYGMTPWLMDAQSIPAMTSILKDLRAGMTFEQKETKLNTPFIYDIKSNTKIVKSPYELSNNDDFAGVAVLPLNGPITKSGGESSLGMMQLSSRMKMYSKDDRIKGFVVLADSGGGSSSAVKIMVDTINEVKQQKPVVGLVEKSGMAASACYGILTACQQIFAEDLMSVVGSVGTMIQFEGYEANSQSPDGMKHIRLYATKSTRKNEAFEQALNEDKYKLITNDLLDPVNEDFIKTVLENRPALGSVKFDDGHTVFAKDAVGTFIDGIKSFAEVVETVAAYKKDKRKKKSSKLLNINTMTKADFKSANPDVYQEIVAEGIASERDRVGAWLAHFATDPKAVAEGINSGEAISAKAREELLVKQHTLATANSMKVESADDLRTGESKGLKEVPQDSVQEKIDASFDFSDNPIKL